MTSTRVFKKNRHKWETVLNQRRAEVAKASPFKQVSDLDILFHAHALLNGEHKDVLNAAVVNVEGGDKGSVLPDVCMELKYGTDRCKWPKTATFAEGKSATFPDNHTVVYASYGTLSVIRVPDLEHPEIPICIRNFDEKTATVSFAVKWYTPDFKELHSGPEEYKSQQQAELFVLWHCSSKGLKAPFVKGVVGDAEISERQIATVVKLIVDEVKRTGMITFGTVKSVRKGIKDIGTRILQATGDKELAACIDGMGVAMDATDKLAAELKAPPKNQSAEEAKKTLSLAYQLNPNLLEYMAKHHKEVKLEPVVSGLGELIADGAAEQVKENKGVVPLPFVVQFMRTPTDLRQAALLAMAKNHPVEFKQFGETWNPACAKVILSGCLHEPVLDKAVRRDIIVERLKHTCAPENAQLLDCMLDEITAICAADAKKQTSSEWQTETMEFMAEHLHFNKAIQNHIDYMDAPGRTLTEIGKHLDEMAPYSDGPEFKALQQIYTNRHKLSSEGKDETDQAYAKHALRVLIMMTRDPVDGGTSGDTSTSTEAAAAMLSKGAIADLQTGLDKLSLERAESAALSVLDDELGFDSDDEGLPELETVPEDDENKFDTVAQREAYFKKAQKLLDDIDRKNGHVVQTDLDKETVRAPETKSTQSILWRISTCSGRKAIDHTTRMQWQNMNTTDRATVLMGLPLDNWFRSSQICKCELLNLVGDCIDKCDKAAIAAVPRRFALSAKSQESLGVGKGYTAELVIGDDAERATLLNAHSTSLAVTREHGKKIVGRIDFHATASSDPSSKQEPQEITPAQRLWNKFASTDREHWLPETAGVLQSRAAVTAAEAEIVIQTKPAEKKDPFFNESKFVQQDEFGELTADEESSFTELSMQGRLLACAKLQKIDNETRARWRGTQLADRCLLIQKLDVSWFFTDLLCGCSQYNIKGDCLDKCDKPVGAGAAKQ